MGVDWKGELTTQTSELGADPKTSSLCHAGENHDGCYPADLEQQRSSWGGGGGGCGHFV